MPIDIQRRKIQASGVGGYLLVYYAQKDGQEVEIGRTPWDDTCDLLGASNTYEEGLLAGLKFLSCQEVEEIVRE